jgi:hypothetical protein
MANKRKCPVVTVRKNLPHFTLETDLVLTIGVNNTGGCGYGREKCTLHSLRGGVDWGQILKTAHMTTTWNRKVSDCVHVAIVLCRNCSKWVDAG